MHLLGPVVTIPELPSPEGPIIAQIKFKLYYNKSQQ